MTDTNDSQGSRRESFNSLDKSLDNDSRSFDTSRLSADSLDQSLRRTRAQIHGKDGKNSKQVRRSNVSDKFAQSMTQVKSIFKSDETSTKHKKNDGEYSSTHASDDPVASSSIALSPKDKFVFSFNVFLKVLGKLVIVMILFLLLLGSLGFGTGLGYFANLVSKTPPPTREEMLKSINQLEQQSSIHYTDGTLIANVQADLVRSVTQLENISPLIVDGIIATEDEYFYEHPGIVPKAIIRAGIESIFKGSGTGGSTITQQLVKQQMLSNDVTFFRKANEILLALRLENHFTKDDILTAYLNVSPFGRNNKGENVAGIAEAAKGIFGKDTKDVSLNQAAFLVGLPQDPYNYTPFDQSGNIRPKEELEAGVTRMKSVLYRMFIEQKISKADYDKAINYDITKDFIGRQAKKEERMNYLYHTVTSEATKKIMEINIKNDGYTLDKIQADPDWYNEYYAAAENQLKTGGYHVYSTIDKDIYDQLQVSAQNNAGNLGQVYEGVYVDPDTGEETPYSEKPQSSVVVIENKTGKVLGFVAGTDFENNQIDHAFNMRRSPGSTIKPLAVYGPAIQEDIIYPASVIPDTPFVHQNNDGTVWEPTNYGGQVSNGFKTARESLMMSLNVPTIRLYQAMLDKGVPVSDYLQKMGFNPSVSYSEDETNYLAFAIGGVNKGATVFEQTRAFTTIANNGQYIEGHVIDKIEDNYGNIIFEQETKSEQVFSEDSNYLLLDILRDTLTNGTATTANQLKNIPGDWIAKTGTSENNKDIWFIASTPSITIGSWIGYDSKFADYNIDVNDGYGHESARSQKFWSAIANDLFAIRPEIFGSELKFEQPASVIQAQVVQTTGTLPGTTVYNGVTLGVAQPIVTDLFKASNPPKPFTFDFLVGATEEDMAIFWNTLQKMYDKEKEETSDEETSEDGEETVQGEVPTDGSQPTTPTTPPVTPGRR